MNLVHRTPALDVSIPGTHLISQSGEAEEDLELLRQRNEQKLQSRFSVIYEKYNRDFAGSSDVIDLVSGSVVVDNGHLSHMRHERDLGTGRRRDHRRPPSPDSGDEDELSMSHDTTAPQASKFAWRGQNTLEDLTKATSTNMASLMAQSALPSAQNLNPADPNSVAQFSQSIMLQMASVMQSLQALTRRPVENHDDNTVFPSPRDNFRTPAEQPQNSQFSHTASRSALRSLPKTAKRDARPSQGRNSIPPQHGPLRAETPKTEVEPGSRTRDGPFFQKGSFVPPQQQPLVAKNLSPSTAQTGWSEDDDLLLVKLMEAKPRDWHMLSRSFPEQSRASLCNRWFDLQERVNPQSQVRSKSPRKSTSARRISTVPSPIRGNIWNASEGDDSDVEVGTRGPMQMWSEDEVNLLRYLRYEKQLKPQDCRPYFPTRTRDSIKSRYTALKLQPDRRIYHKSNHPVSINAAQQPPLPPNDERLAIPLLYPREKPVLTMTQTEEQMTRPSSVSSESATEEEELPTRDSELPETVESKLGGNKKSRPRIKWTEDETKLLVDLKDNHGLSLTEIRDKCFPMRTKYAVSKCYKLYQLKLRCANIEDPTVQDEGSPQPRSYPRDSVRGGSRGTIANKPRSKTLETTNFESAWSSIDDLTDEIPHLQDSRPIHEHSNLEGDPSFPSRHGKSQTATGSFGNAVRNPRSSLPSRKRKRTSLADGYDEGNVMSASYKSSPALLSTAKRQISGASHSRRNPVLNSGPKKGGSSGHAQYDLSNDFDVIPDSEDYDN